MNKLWNSLLYKATAIIVSISLVLSLIPPLPSSASNSAVYPQEDRVQESLGTKTGPAASRYVNSPLYSSPAVSLNAYITPTISFAGDRSLSLVIEALDASGNLDPDYRGALNINPSAGTSSLPQSPNGFLADYTFTAADAGRHVFENFGFNQDGQHTIFIIDRNDSALQVTTNAVTVQPVWLYAVITPTVSFASEQTLTMTVEARDINDNLVSGYRGALNINPSTSTSGLPQSPNNFLADYTFTEVDAGRHVFPKFSFNGDGQQTITVIDRAYTSRQTTTNPVTVTAVSLHAMITPTTAFAGEQTLTLTIEARDPSGNLVPGYRGALNINPSTSTTGLPQSATSFHPDYTFTEVDAGRHVFPDFSFNGHGQHTITVIDRNYTSRWVTTNPVTVTDVTLVATITPTTAIAGVQSLTLTIEALDPNGDLVPGYRGALDINPTTSTTGLPQSATHFHPDYVFTEADGGRHVFPNFSFNNGGEHTITVIDRSNSSRQDTSNSVEVAGIHFQVTMIPTTTYAGVQDLALTVEVLDENDQRVTDYRGGIDFSASAPVWGLPSSSSSFYHDYTFTPADAGIHTFTGLGFATPGNQNVTVSSGIHQATSNDVLVKDVALQTAITPTTVVAGDPVTLTISAVDAETETLLTDFQGTLGISSTLPHSFNGAYTFTPEDGGTTDLIFGFSAVGIGTVSVFDVDYPARQSIPIVITVTAPPPPSPVPVAETPPAPFDVPTTIGWPAPLSYSWGLPFLISDTLDSNVWEGYPDYPVPASPDALYLVSGVAQRGVAPWWGTYYACPWLAWENPLTDERQSGGGLVSPGLGDSTAFDFGLAACSWPISFDVSILPLTLSDPAPTHTQGVHLDIHAGGNSSGHFIFSANAIGDAHECDGQQESVSVGDPIDTRSGEFYLSEHDLGIETGCQGISLRFERSYSSLRPLGDSLGPGWTHNYAQAVIPLANDYVAVRRPRGSYLLFRDTGGDVYAARAGSQHALMKRPEGGWALVRQDRHVDMFDVQGRLIAQQDPNGNLIWLTYETYSRYGVTGSRLARVDTPGGRYLWFGYDYYQPDRLVQVGDHSGRSVYFDYNPDGYLSEVTDVLGATAVYTYENGFLATKVNALDITVFDNTYDTHGRVVAQTNHLGQQLSLDYVTSSSGITTTVTEQQTGAQTVYVYGTEGLLRQVIDPLGGQTHYREYTDTRRATEIEDALGHITRIQYDERGRPITVTNALSHTVSIAYDDWSNPTIITDTLGRTTQFIYDGPNLTEVIDPAGNDVRFLYEDQAGWQDMLTQIINQAGVTTTLSYDTAGDLVSITDPLEGVTQLGYDNLGRIITVTDALSYTTVLSYSVGDQLLQVQDPLSGTVRYEYNILGNLVRLLDQAGAATTITYTHNMLPVQLTDALSGTITIGYDAVGRPVTLTDQLDNQTTIQYDIAGRPVAITNALGQTTYMGYDLLGNTTVITDANGHALEIEYDALSRPVVLRNALGQTIAYQYDAAGNVIRITDAAGDYVSIGYDELSRPVVITDQLGITTTYQYNSQDLLTDVRDGNGIVTHYSYDSLGRLIEVVANYRPGLPATPDANVRTQYAYDPVGNLLSITDPNNHVTSFTYDPLGRMLSATDPLSRTMAYKYDLRGLLTGWTKADETLITYGYDVLGRLDEIVTPDGDISFLYDAAGRRIGMADGEGFTEYEYDTLGRPITITLPSGEEVGYRYDHVGNRTWLIYPDGQEVQYQYNEANQLVKVIDWDMQETTYQYDIVGRPVTLTLPNGITTSLTYDDAGNLFSLTHQSITGTIGSYVYEYDNTGRRIGAVETGRVITYTYDALYRLTDAVESTGDVYQYAYDAAGNRLLKVEPGEIVTATYDTANQLLALGGIPVLHDTNGNLVHDGVYTYTYNSLDQLVAVSNGITTTLYGYNGDGDRLWQNTEGVTTTYTLDLNSALAQVLVQTQGGVTTSFLPGIGQKVNDTWTYFHSDALGSVRHLTGPAGQVLGDIRYSPFGEVEDSTGLAPAFGFTGEQQESTLGLVYLRARVYSPALGRFLTPDSIIPDVTNGQSLNAYAYVYNDPVNLVDPSGNIPNVGSAVVDVAKRLPVSWQSRIKEGAAAGLAGLDAWYGRPDSCECSLDPYNSIINHPLTTPSIAGQPFPVTPGIIANTGYQLWWAYKSTPATRIATKTVEKFSVSLTRVSHKVPQLLVDRLWPFVPTRVSLPSLSWGWHVTGQASGSYTFIPSGRYPTGLFKRATIERGPLRIRPGVTGFVGSIAGAGLIDALWQTLIDLGNKCLSPNQRFWRSSTAFGLGLVAGAAGAVAFTLLVSFTLPAGVAALGGFVASAGVGYLLNREIKEPYFAANPARYGY